MKALVAALAVAGPAAKEASKVVREHRESSPKIQQGIVKVEAARAAWINADPKNKALYDNISRQIAGHAKEFGSSIEREDWGDCRRAIFAYSALVDELAVLGAPVGDMRADTERMHIDLDNAKARKIGRRIFKAEACSRSCVNKGTRELNGDLQPAVRALNELKQFVQTSRATLDLTEHEAAVKAIEERVEFQKQRKASRRQTSAA